MTSGGFDGRARLASGSKPTPSATSYRVTVASGSLRLGPAATLGVVVYVPVARVHARPLGRGGSVVVEVDGSPLLLDFSDAADAGTTSPAGPTTKALRVVQKGRGRHRRDRFLRALEASPR